MLRPFTPTRCLLLLACVSSVLIFALVPRYDLLDGPEVNPVAPRGLFGIGDDDNNSSSGSASSASASSSPATSVSATTSSPTTSSPVTSASATPTSQPSTPTSAPSSSPASTPETSASATPTSSSGPSSTPPPNTPTPTPTPAQTFLSESASVDQDGSTSLIVVTITRSDSSSSASASSTAGADQSSGDDSDSKGVSTSTIIGLSVAGGVALIGIIAFVIWKFTRKRFADDFDDSEAIKWPELNTHGESPHALSTNRTGGSGFETNSEVNLTRPDSRAGSFAPSAAASAVDLYAPNAAQDPYAVPPLPHQNPNLPYRDDPAGTFYDPYSGPVPQTFADNESVAGGEAIPMTQIGRARSPAPPMGYDAGRASPGPQMAYNVPPQAPYYNEGGRSSPAPRTMSPGPAMALSGRASPGPQAAYGYGGGAAAPPPPGLHQGY